MLCICIHKMFKKTLNKMLSCKFSVKLLIAMLSLLLIYNIVDRGFSLFFLKEGLEGSDGGQDDNVQEENNKTMQADQNSQYQEYSKQQNTPMVLAQKNQANIMALREQLAKLGDIQKLIVDLTSRVDVNEKNIQALTNAQTAQQQSMAKKNEQRAQLTK